MRKSENGGLKHITLLFHEVQLSYIHRNALQALFQWI